MLKPREKRLLYAALLLAGCWAVVGFLLEPLWHRASALNHEVMLQTEKLEALNQIVQRSASIERRYQVIEPYLSEYSEEAGARTLLEELEILSRRLTIPLNLKPRPAPRRGAKTFDVEVDLEGSQKQIFAFLDNVLAMPQLILIQRLSISAIPRKPNLLRANLVIQQIQL